MRNSAFIFKNWKMKNGFSIFYFPIKIGKWKLKFFYHFSIFNFESKLKYIKISFFILILKWKLNGTFSARIEKKGFLNLFWFKINFKKQKSKYWNSFFDFKSKNEFQKFLSFFQFWLWNWNMKNEKFSKFVFFLNQKTNYTFGTRIQYMYCTHEFLNSNPNSKLISNSNSNLNLNSSSNSNWNWNSNSIQFQGQIATQIHNQVQSQIRFTIQF